MVKDKLYVGAILILVIIFLVGCTGDQRQESPTPVPTPSSPTPPVTSHGGPVKDFVSLVDNMRGSGANVEPVGEVTQPFFAVEGFVIRVDGADVQVFEYSDIATAESEAQLVSPDGSSVGTSMISWIASPHFYNKERLIVLYVGDDTSVLATLEEVLGKQFAGK
jgi:hypothetical protein